MHFTVHGKKLYSAAQYINISVILSSEMSFLTPKTMEKTYNIPILNSFVKKCTFFCTVQYSTVPYIKKVIISSTEMDFLAPKTPKLTYHMSKSDE